MTPLDEETCYVLPAEPSTRLLIYLHGIVPPQADSVIKSNLEGVVARASRRAGVVGLLPRGVRGLAPPGHDGWWGWPTTPGGYRRYAATLTRSFEEKRRRLEERIGFRFSRVYLAGSSSGAYFVAALALHGGFAADGFGAMSGGAGRATPELGRLSPTPFYIGYGKHDRVGASARVLGGVLARASWPVRVSEQPVGHGAREIYLDEAFAFWQSAANVR